MATHATTNDTDTASASEGWQGKDRSAKALRWLILAAPIVAAINVSLVLNHALPAPSSWSWAIVRVAAIAIVAMASIGDRRAGWRGGCCLCRHCCDCRWCFPIEHPRGSRWRSKPAAASGWNANSIEAARMDCPRIRAERRNSWCCCRPRSERTIGAPEDTRSGFGSTPSCSARNSTSAPTSGTSCNGRR